MKKLSSILLAAILCSHSFFVSCRQRSQITPYNQPRQIETIHFLIHGLCYADMTEGKNGDQLDAKTACYLARETQCAASWRKRIAQFTEKEILVAIPWNNKPSGPVHQFNAYAHATLGDRFFLLDCVDALNPNFWQSDDADFSTALVMELQSFIVNEKEKWNKEELYTALHCVNSSRQLTLLLGERNFQFDPHSVAATAWGASFEGCVSKYSLHFRRLLGLTKPVFIDFSMTVPDAFFLLDAAVDESSTLDDSTGLYLFKNRNQILACYNATSLPSTGKPVSVRLAMGEKQITVFSKQGLRLWPDPQPYHLPTAPSGYYEPPQSIVQWKNGQLHVPVGQGYVYRLAKAPVFIFKGADLSEQEFREILKHPDH